jgi:hypothetical protein
VIGGLVASTFVTLFIVPSIFALLMGKKTPASPSLHPDDPESSYYAADGREPEAAAHADSTVSHPPAPEDDP